jgi:hypothetical protein
MTARTPIALTADAERRVQAVYAPEERAEARRMLELDCGSAVESGWGKEPAAYDRVRFAAMKASFGRLEGLRRAIALAQVDWRDLLVEAGFAHDATEHTRWLVPGSPEEQRALDRWVPRDPLAGSALPLVAGIVIQPMQRHASTLAFTVHGVPALEFVHGLLSALRVGEEVMLPDPQDDCGCYVRAVPGGWQTRLICHGRFGDPWHDANRRRAAAWLLPAAESMVANARIEGAITLQNP